MTDTTSVNPINLVAIIGSLRAGSFNRMVFNAAAGALPDGVSLTEIPIGDVPLYNGDVEDAGDPTAVTALKEAVDAADGLVIFTPEYNGSYPAVTKNVIDWLSRPPKSWEGRGFTMVVTTPGSRGGESIRGHFDTSMGYFNVKHFPALGIGSYFDKIEDGEMTDAETIDTMKTFIAEFAAHSVSEAEGAS